MDCGWSTYPTDSRASVASDTNVGGAVSLGPNSIGQRRKRWAVTIVTLVGGCAVIVGVLLAVSHKRSGLTVMSAGVPQAVAAKTSTQQGGVGAITISPASGPPYTPITVSGAHCAGANAVVSVTYKPEGVGGAQYSASPDALGNWSVTMFAAPVLPPGPTQIWADCVHQGEGTSTYEPATFEITGGEQASFDVQPRAILRGVATTLTVSGTACHAPADSVSVTVLTSDDSVDASAVPDVSGAWTAKVAITPTATARIQVHAWCVHGTQKAFAYPSMRVPVGDSSFTG